MTQYFTGLKNMIPQSKRAKAALYYFAMHPNNRKIDDPDWITANPDWKTEGLTPPQIMKYTDSEWFDVSVQELVENRIRKGVIKVGNEAFADKEFKPFEE